MGLKRTTTVHVPVSRWGVLAPIEYTHHVNTHLRPGSGAVLLSTGPMGNYRCPVPHISTFHDMYRLIPGRYKWYQRKFFEIYARAVMRRSAAVIAVSHATAKDLVAWAPLAERKLRVIGEGSQFAADLAYNLNSTSLLFVANIEANKNVGCLLEALRLLEAEGEQVEVRWIGRDRSGELHRWLETNGPLRSLTALGVLDKESLEAEYRRAGALVVTSTAEGFCLPVLEAQGFGVPTILADIPVLREVGGGAALHFDPRNPGTLAEAIRLFRADRSLRERLSEDGSKNGARYSWKLAATEIIRLADTLR